MTAREMDAPSLRDYSLTGPSTRRAAERGLVSGEWYKCPVPRARMKQLMERRDGPAIRDTVIWLGALGISGFSIYYFWGSWWAVPFAIVYGVLYGSSGD